MTKLSVNLNKVALVRNTRHLEAFLSNVVKSVSGIQRTESMIVLSSPKETSSLATEEPKWDMTT